MKQPPILHAEISGAGPTVILVHGYLATSQYWTKLRKKLEATNTVVAIDLLGFGMSPKPLWSTYNYSVQIASILATLQKLNISQPFVLMGHSMGALIALRFARLYPEQVHELFLTNMPVMVSKKEAKREIYGTSIAYRVGLSAVGTRTVWPLFQILSRLRRQTRIAPDNDGQFSFMFQNTAASRIRSFRRIIVEAQTENDLRTLSSKTSIIVGLHDRKLYMTNLASMTFNQNISLYYFEGGHHLSHTQTDSLASLVRT